MIELDVFDAVFLLGFLAGHTPNYEAQHYCVIYEVIPVLIWFQVDMLGQAWIARAYGAV